MRGASWHGADSEIPTSSVIDAVMSSIQPRVSTFGQYHSAECAALMR